MIRRFLDRLAVALSCVAFAALFYGVLYVGLTR